MIQKILSVKEPSLRQKSKPVKKYDKKLKLLIKDLKDTLIAQKNPEGIGLAAPQIGKNVRVFIIKPQNYIEVFINPEVIEMKKLKVNKKNDKKIMEGCLSLPHFYGPLERSFKVRLKYQNEEGKYFDKEFDGLNAQIVLHEIDHLDGVLFIDRLLEQKGKLYEFKNGEWSEVELI